MINKTFEDSLRVMVSNRLAFNSMFDPLAKFIIRLDKDKFEVLFQKGLDKVNAEKERIESLGLSIGKRNSDNIAIAAMRKSCLEIHYDECKSIMEEAVRGEFKNDTI